jgi:hypothetical protein
MYSLILILPPQPPIDESDYLGNSTPHPVNKRLVIGGMKLVAPLQQPIWNDYEAGGFKLNHGPDDAGVLYAALQNSGGYHIDVGNHKYYKNGTIKVKQGQEITEITESGVKLADGSSLSADEIILATGFKDRESLTRKAFGDAIADKLNGFGGLNAEGEWSVEWRPSGCPGFWVTLGNMCWSRYWSRILALQIQAIERDVYSIW